MNTASSAPTTNLAMASHAMYLAARLRPPGLAAAKARCWLEDNWIRPAAWSWPMCRTMAFLEPFDRLEVGEIVALTGWNWQHQRGVLF